MIWLIAGTKSARELAEKLTESGHEVLATTTTEYGRDLLGSRKGLTALAGKLDYEKMKELTGEYNINLIIDASHPYSVEVKKNAHAVSLTMNIPVIRYDRKPLKIEGTLNFSTYAGAAESLENEEGNVLLTIGSNNVHYFKESPERKVYARVLPTEESISQCRRGGLEPDRIIAMKYTFSGDFEKALYRELDIKYLVTKESGTEGGASEKITTALESGIRVLLIERPRAEYREIYYDADDVIRRTEELIDG